MDTNSSGLTNALAHVATNGTHSDWTRFLYEPPNALVQLALVALVGWAFRHVVHWLADRLRQGNGAHISVMLCMSLMWVYGFLETSVQHGLTRGEPKPEWWSHPFVFACAGSSFMLVSMWLYIKSKSKGDDSGT